MEPIMGNSGSIPPEPGFLQGVREATLKHNAMLIFDEVITGLRVAPGGAAEHYCVTPDITVISKALGGGYPVAAFGRSLDDGFDHPGRVVPRLCLFGQPDEHGGLRRGAGRGAGRRPRHVCLRCTRWATGWPTGSARS